MENDAKQPAANEVASLPPDKALALSQSPTKTIVAVAQAKAIIASSAKPTDKK